MDAEAKNWMENNSEGIRAEAQKLFRLECIETLTWPPCSSLPEIIKGQKSESIEFELGENLNNGAIGPMEPSTYISPKIDSDGNIIDFIEEARSSAEFGSSTVSMSINRAPFKYANANTSSIKGSSSNVPFLPGYVDDLDEFLESESSIECKHDELKFLDFSNPDKFLMDVPVIGTVVFPAVAPTPSSEEKEEIEEKASFDLESGDFFDLIDFVSSGAPVCVPEAESANPTENDEKPECDEPDEKPVEDEIDVPLLEAEKTNDDDDDDSTTPPNISTEKFAYAKEVETLSDFEEYKQLLPTMARKYPFDLDPFQQASVLCMERGESLFVAAHTSAGKTVVAEYAIAMCKSHKTRAIYTSPIKALSNQKFRDFKQIFDDVGLVTGDIQLHPEAFCIIMTTEILRSMLYNGSDVIRDLEWVVFDEVHYINNEERGHVWEEVLIMLPAHVKIVMLSATVPNCVEFADWVGRIKNRRINVISTLRRPVPLEHYLYTGQDGKTQRDLFKIIDRNGNFIMKGYREAKEAKEKLSEKAQRMMSQQNTRGGGVGANGRGRGNGRGNGRPANSGKSWPGKNDKAIYLNLINFMKANDQLPLVAFVFSRKRCDENAQLLSSMDLTSAVEKSHVHKFFSQCIDRLKGSDKQLPQVLTMQEMCLRGFAVHHSGILPILKEVVEMLFQKGYVKILFATETFAMGVNMPARCVVFDSISKHDGTERRLLNPGEYTQMAGRAGRRGLDSTGTVIVLCKDAHVPPYEGLCKLMSGSALRLESKFRVTYSMLLNLLRVEQLRIEDMLKRSFVESDSLRESRDRKKLLKDAQKMLDEMSTTECSVCVPADSSNWEGSLLAFHDALANFVATRAELWPKLNGEISINKLFASGRFLIVSSAQHGLQNDLVMLLKEMQNGGTRTLQIMYPVKDYDECHERNQSAENFLKLSKKESEWETEENAMLGVALYGVLGVRAHSEERNFFRVCEVAFNTVVGVVKKIAKAVNIADIVQDYQLKMLPRFRKQAVADMTAKAIQQCISVAADIHKNEIEVYQMIELVRSVSNIELNNDASMAASAELDFLDSQAFPARYCTRFEEHFSKLRNRVKVERAASTLQYELSSDALLLSEEYQNKLKVLEELEFVQADKMVSLRGRVACEIHHQELLITELILGYKFHTRPPAELAALLSTLTCQYNSGKELKFDKDSVFFEIRECVESVMKRLETIAARNKAQIAEVGGEIRYDLMEVVYNWALGVPFAEIMKLTDAHEGLIVKCIQRLDEVCKDVRNAGRIVGDPALVEKMEEVSASIRRDIVFAASLYTSMRLTSDESAQKFIIETVRSPEEFIKVVSNIQYKFPYSRIPDDYPFKAEREERIKRRFYLAIISLLVLSVLSLLTIMFMTSLARYNERKNAHKGHQAHHKHSNEIRIEKNPLSKEPTNSKEARPKHSKEKIDKQPESKKSEREKERAVSPAPTMDKSQGGSKNRSKKNSEKIGSKEKAPGKDGASEKDASMKAEKVAQAVSKERSEEKEKVTQDVDESMKAQKPTETSTKTN
ncbi:unnamed protein product [Caenorhabditis bovis]|uniref:Helicase SKI2W n=1 Tax=Caenorhabditis bovis TaxID=2654633 RepID=A0A8S1FDW1_9PELO|nr:unnamed protein product [Caenorhabditis bovis]